MEKIDNALVTPTSGKIENIEEEYVRIGTTLFRIINQPMMNGSFRKMRVEWKMSVFRLDHGKDEAALNSEIWRILHYAKSYRLPIKRE